MNVDRKRPCVVCGAVEDHPVHGRYAAQGRPHPVLMVNHRRCYAHTYDPGERRNFEERRK